MQEIKLKINFEVIVTNKLKFQTVIVLECLYLRYYLLPLNHALDGPQVYFRNVNLAY